MASDPIHLRAPPKEDELSLGARLNLYTKNSHTLIAQGSVIEGDRGANQMRNDYFDSNSCTGGACALSESSRSRAPAAIGVVHRGARKVGFGEIFF